MRKILPPHPPTFGFLGVERRHDAQESETQRGAGASTEADKVGVVGAQHEYFVVDKTELAGMDLTKSPVSQLPAERAAELPGVDPTVVLLSLVEVLTTVDFDTLIAESADELVFDGGDDGPWAVAVDRAAVVAIQGADGDPEMEWEDAVEQWGALVAEELGDPDDEALLEITDELRRLCGEVSGERWLYCWTS